MFTILCLIYFFFFAPHENAEAGIFYILGGVLIDVLLVLRLMVGS